MQKGVSNGKRKNSNGEKKLEMEERIQKEKLEQAEKENERQSNLRMKKLEMQDKAKTKPLDLGTHSDITKHIRLVPLFQEKEFEVDKYFLYFEKVAENLKWPKEHWTLLLQSVVIGKAREIYTRLSLEQSSDYDIVKDLILKPYELVPEAYRQKFRNSRKENDQTHVEFARTKKQLFDRWCSLKKIGSDYPKLRQLMPVEEFKRCINSDVKSFLDEKEVETLEKAARLADDYTLTHKSRKETPQKLTQLSSRSHPRHLVGKRTAQKDITIDTTSDSQVNSSFPNKWSPASLTFNNYFYLFLYLYIT